MKTFKTKLGTELPLLNLKGKDYLTVPYRIMWMREEQPEWGITTEFLRLEDGVAIAKATIRAASGFIIAQATKTETPAGFADFVEKAETGAVGRALALCGYGTQFATELEEAERIVDAPQAPRAQINPAPVSSLARLAVAANPEALGDYLLRFGKFKGKKLAEIGAHDLDNYLQWLKKEKVAGEDDSPAMVAIEKFVKSREVKRG